MAVWDEGFPSFCLCLFVVCVVLEGQKECPLPAGSSSRRGVPLRASTSPVSLFNEFEELSRLCAWGGAQSAMCLLRSSSTGLLQRPQVFLIGASCAQTSFWRSRLAWKDRGRRATSDACFDVEEEAMLRQEEERAGGAVADEEESRTNASSSTAPSSSAAASVSSSAAVGSASASSTSAWLVHASVPAMRVGVGAIQTFLDTHPWCFGWSSQKKKRREHTTPQPIN